MTGRTGVDDAMGATSGAAGPSEVAALVGAEREAVRDRVLERLGAWVELESPSGDAERITALAGEIAAELEKAGAEVERRDAGDAGQNLIARVPGLEPELEPVVVLCHMDTVHPVGTLVDQPFRVVDDRAEGPGVYDMKAGIAVLAETLSLLARTGSGPRRPVHALISCDEEAGSLTALPIIESEARDAAAVLVLEPPLPGGAAKTRRKGVASYRLRVRGRAAHAGLEPERGVSATLELAHQLVRIAELADPGRGTTINIGMMEGGTAVNVVAADAFADVDVRFATEDECDRVDAAIRALEPVLPGAELIIEYADRRPPLERTDGVVRLYEHARTAAAELGPGLAFELEEGGTGGGSDGCYTAALGVPTLDGIGVEGDGAHSENEYILVDDLPRRVALLGRLLETL